MTFSKCSKLLLIIIVALHTICISANDDIDGNLIDSNVTEYKIGVILIQGHGAPYDFARSAPAIDVALEKLNRDILNSSYQLTMIQRTYGPECDAALAPGLAADMFYNEDIIALVGPGCTYALDPVGRLASYWNIPIVTGVGDSGRFKDKSDYKTMTRFAYCQCRLRKVFGSVFAEFSWTDIALIIDQDDVHGAILGETLQAGLQKGGIYPYVIKYYGEQNTSLERLLTEASRNSRVIVLSVNGRTVRDFMLAAESLGFINGEYVFVDVELFRFQGDYWGDHHWRIGDADDRRAKFAYTAMLRIALQNPTGDLYDEFNRQVQQRSRDVYNYTYYEDEQANFFVGAFHDAMLMYGTALNETLDLGRDIRDGYEMARQMWNRNFIGITDEIFIDDNGDRDTSYTIQDMDPESGEFRIVAHYWGDRPGYTPVEGVPIHWPGGRKHPPPNEPYCWFKYDNPECEETEPFSATLVILIALLGGLLISCVGGFIMYRRYQLENTLKDMSWLIRGCDVNQKHSRAVSSMRMSMLSEVSDSTTATLDGAQTQLFTDIGVHNGHNVAIRVIRQKKPIDLKRSVIVEINTRRNLQHINVVQFIGAVLEPPKMFVLHEYCPKGSLQDLLANDSITLDPVFKMSLIEDIVKGMIYIHSSPVSTHGRLQSSNCLVDNRFTLKLTDFGLPTFYVEDDDELDNKHRMYSKLLYHAPELLRHSKGGPTHKSDVYSLGIVLEEIIVRGGPYEEASPDYTPEEIVEKVRCPKDKNKTFRPFIPESAGLPALRKLMDDCLEELPSDRPDFSAIKTQLRTMNGGKETNILDNLLKRMEQYATNLESVVNDRTQLLLQEQKKTEQLLLQILPKTIADQLKCGETVKPETFENVTIYFSDIVGFTALSAASTPLQIVNMLNDLYTLFDSIIVEFDVYKVETIGDAYMIVSGLPTRNGDQHAGQIARVSLKLLDAMKQFRVKHIPNEEMKLRIGLHTGSVVAGVVGLKMPRYCLFGDTVNTASRMESNGEPLRVHMSCDTHAVLMKLGNFATEKRGMIAVKGKGEMATYWLKGEKKAEQEKSSLNNVTKTVSSAQ